MANMNRTLGALLSDARIAPIADKAIWKRDLSQEEMWHKTLAQLKEEQFGGELAQGFDRLFAAVEKGNLSLAHATASDIMSIVIAANVQKNGCLIPSCNVNIPLITTQAS